jgi:hypothetical protein
MDADPLTILTGLKNKSKVTLEIKQCWIFAVLWWPFWKWRPVEIFRCQESIQDIIIYPHMKCRWNRTMLHLCSIVVAILKMGHFQNGRYNTAQIQHCPISTTFHIWVDYDVPNLLPTLNIIIYPHIKCWWYLTMLNLCGIVVTILKMVTARNFSMSGIYPGHHNLPTYENKFNIVRFQRHFICG